MGTEICETVFKSGTVGCDDGDFDIWNDLCDGSGGCFGELIVCSEIIFCTFVYMKNGVDCMVNFVF